MGTLHSQPERDFKRVTQFDIEEKILRIQAVSKVTGISFDQALRVWELQEQIRRNDLFVANGDIWDEQIGGIGDAIERIGSALEVSKEDSE